HCVRSPDLRRAVPPHAKMKHSACLFIRQTCQSGRQVQSMKTKRGLSCGAHYRGARCQPSVSSTGNIIACTRRVLHSQ
ncbi:hypothetical protein, partial [Escherichia coli]|uniref:hypothetical protein n=1 Tax=Escherichia coli TaxID=562 RepID=UPI002665AF74